MMQLDIFGLKHSGIRYTNSELYEAVLKHIKRSTFSGDLLAVKCLKDSERTITLMDTISKTTKTGSVGVDLGAGTGVLSFAFINAGGELVYSVDNSYKCSLFVEHMARELGFEGKVKPVHGDATKYRPDHSIDYVMAELVHTGLQSEPVVAAMSNIRDFVSSSVQFLPAGAISYISFYNLSFSQGRHPIRMSERHPYDSVDFRALSKNTVDCAVEVPITRTGSIDGVLVETELVLPDSTRATNFRTLCPNFQCSVSMNGDNNSTHFPVRVGEKYKIHIKYAYGEFIRDLKAIPIN